jgi:hypothetical protein
MLWHTALLYVANAVLKDTCDPNWQFYFLLCIRGYQNLYPSFRSVENIVQGLMAMAMRKGVLSNGAAQLLMQQLYEKGRHHRLADRTRTAFILDLDRAMTNQREAEVDSLANLFEEMTVFDAFTVNEDYEATDPVKNEMETE